MRSATAIDLTVLVADASAAPRPRDRRGRALLHLTTNEVRHLINVLIIKPTHHAAYYLTWSTWRRAHQDLARRLHYRRRGAG